MKKRYLILGLIALLFVLYTVMFNRSPETVPAAETMPFDRAGFVSSLSLDDTNKLVQENDNFALYIDETKSYFHVEDKRNGVIWRSNPNVPDPWQFDPDKNITNSAVQKQRSTLELSYFNETGALATVNNYKYSIYHPRSILNSEGFRTFSIKYTDTGFQVLYLIEDLEIDYLYFPKYLTPEVFENLPNRTELETIAYTSYDDEQDLYYIKQYETMSVLVRERLYDTFYGEGSLGYTRERAIEENAQYGYVDTFEKIRFEIAIDVSLTEYGVVTSVIQDSIVEPSNVKLASVSLFPLFGTAISKFAGTPQNGYVVLPDGSGAVMNFNNGKYYQEPYVKRLYGQDLSLLPYKMAEVQEKISIPLYGMIKENQAGFAAIITKGDAMATIHADVSGRIDSFNKAYTSFRFRVNESITLGSGFNQYGVDLWTEERVDTDFAVEYHFLEDLNSDYVDIAHVYQNHLITKGLLEQDDSTDTVVTTEFIGAFDQRQFILGVPYYTTKSMTTFEQAEEILEELQARGIHHINVQYTGMMNGGLTTTVNDRFAIERSLGSKREYRDFVSYLEEQDINFYPMLQLVTASDYRKLFDRFRYTASRLDGDQSLLFDYHLPSKLPYSETPYQFGKEDYVINPLYLEGIFADFDEDYDHDHIGFQRIGSILGGDYSDDSVTYKQDAMRIQERLLANMDETVLLQNPLAFAIPYADYITDLPTETTLYAILDYQIPLLQLILSGYVDYSTASLNLNSARGTEYNFLKILETGSNVKFTLSYEDSIELRDTEYNYYLSTQYENWLDDMEHMVETLNDIGIHQGRLIRHTVIQNNVVEVEYSNGVILLLNYNLSPVTIGTDTIGAVDYVVKGGN